VGDIALQWSPDGAGAGLIDMAISDDDVLSDEGLRTSVILSLFTDRRADDADTLPDGGDDRRGWWADEFGEVEGDRIGSRLWLLDRSKRTPDILPRAEAFAREALAWLLTDRVAARIDATATATGATLTLAVTIWRPTGERAEFRFGHTWDGEATNAI
jgi:phage gp46-like protein